MNAGRGRLGRIGEIAVAAYLERAGWKIVERNYRCPYGEIDIVGWDGRTLVFVEVRTRSSDRFGTPEESITATKKAHMARCAIAYLGSQPAPPTDWRVDVVAVVLAKGRVVRLEHFKHALQ
ncbi:MAG TPA: YraN family protein [Chloroflexota bacterium]|jgi:putative endonuclease|nr:YraN family protein [Chloroflexota bacterium]